jgi:hypothetical protein
MKADTEKRLKKPCKYDIIFDLMIHINLSESTEDRFEQGKKYAYFQVLIDLCRCFQKEIKFGTEKTQS